MSVAVVLLSGGIDSATALYWALKQSYTVLAVTYNHRSRPSREREAARIIAHRAGVSHLEIELPFLQTAADIMKENIDAFKEIKVPEGYVPTRNLIFYTLAAYYAEIYRANYIIGGHLETDSIEFPDATPGFFMAIEQIINDTRLNEGPNVTNRINLLMPFLQRSKADVVRIARELKVPLELTWSCYHDGTEQCGECESCSERADAFAEAGLTDPLMLDVKKDP